MPIEYELRLDSILLRTVGDVDYEGGLAAFEAAVAAARAEGAGPRPVVFDIRESREERSAEELRGIADFVARQRDVLAPRCAIVAGDDLHFGLARMFEAYAEGHAVDVVVLRSFEGVQAWLAAGSGGAGGAPP